MKCPTCDGKKEIVTIPPDRGAAVHSVCPACGGTGRLTDRSNPLHYPVLRAVAVEIVDKAGDAQMVLEAGDAGPQVRINDVDGDGWFTLCVADLRKLSKE